MDGHFSELFAAGLILLVMFLVGFTGAKYKVPEVVVFILLGILLSAPLGDADILAFAGEIGIVLLFFMLGMEFPLKQLAGIAKKVTPAGSLDLLLSLGITMVISLLFGFDLLSAFIIGGVVYATSSSMTMKMLETTKRTANPESEFLLGVLIFEDIAAPILIAILTGLISGQHVTASSLSVISVKLILLIVGAILLGQVLFRRLSSFFEKHASKDVFVLFLVGMALTYAGLAIYLQLSEILGAFLAGIMLAETRKSEKIEHLVLPVRDLMLPLFFFWFGTQIEFESGIPMPLLLATILLWSILAKILVGIIGGRWYGLSPRVSFRAGLSFTQRGEFSIIIASLAAAEMMVFSSLFILLSTVIGILFFLYAPAITKKIYGTKKRQGKVKVPGS